MSAHVLLDIAGDEAPVDAPLVVAVLGAAVQYDTQSSYTLHVFGHRHFIVGSSGLLQKEAPRSGQLASVSSHTDVSLVGVLKALVRSASAHSRVKLHHPPDAFSFWAFQDCKSLHTFALLLW